MCANNYQPLQNKISSFKKLQPKLLFGYNQINFYLKYLCGSQFLTNLKKRKHNLLSVFVQVIMLMLLKTKQKLTSNYFFFPKNTMYVYTTFEITKRLFWFYSVWKCQKKYATKIWIGCCWWWCFLFWFQSNYNCPKIFKYWLHHFLFLFLIFKIYNFL